MLIGIAGPSCSGKTMLAISLAGHLKPPGTAIITLDSYYHDLFKIAPDDRMKCNFDIPDSLDWELLTSHVNALAAGKEIEKPVYLYPSHTRAEHGKNVIPGNYLIIEGLFALYNEEIRQLLDVCVYISLDNDTCLKRRIARDTVERGRSRDSIINQYENTVRPMAEKYVLPAEAVADIVVNGDRPVEESAARIIEYLKSR